MSPPPNTVSRAALLVEGSDEAFRAMVDDLTHFASRLQQIREALARQMGVTAPQYAVLMALARRPPNTPVGVKDLASRLRVSVPFIVTETKKLEALGFVSKKPVADDKRKIDIVLTDKGSLAIEAIGDRQRAVNDVLFASLNVTKFSALRTIASELLNSCDRAFELAEK